MSSGATDVPTVMASTSTGDLEDGLPTWAGTPVLTTPLGILSLHMMKLACPNAVARLWQVFVRTMAVEYCENLATFGTFLDTDSHRNVLRQLGFASSLPTVPHSLWLQYVNDRVGDMVRANKFMEWALAEADWEAAELGYSGPSSPATFGTIEEDHIGEMEDVTTGEGARTAGSIGHEIERMLRWLKSSTHSAITSNTAASGLQSDNSATGGSAPPQAQAARHDPHGGMLLDQHKLEVCPDNPSRFLIT